MNERRKRFVEAYVKDPNATQAAIEAGYGDTQHSIEVQGSRLLKNVEVQQAIAARAQTAAERVGVTPERVLEGLLDTATAAFQDKAYGAATQAWTQLGRHLQLFVDRIDLVAIDAKAAELASELGLDPTELKAEAQKLLDKPK